MIYSVKSTVLKTFNKMLKFLIFVNFDVLRGMGKGRLRYCSKMDQPFLSYEITVFYLRETSHRPAQTILLGPNQLIGITLNQFHM